MAEPAKWQLQKVFLWLAKHTQHTNTPTKIRAVYSSSDIVLMAEHTPPPGMEPLQKCLAEVAVNIR